MKQTDGDSTSKIFYIEIRLQTPHESARTVIEDFHTNLTVTEYNGRQSGVSEHEENAKKETRIK